MFVLCGFVEFIVINQICARGERTGRSMEAGRAVTAVTESCGWVRMERLE